MCYRTLFFFLLTAFLPQILPAQTTSLLTFNIRYDNPGDKENNWHQRKADVVELINHYEPAIFGIQEGLHHQVVYMDTSLKNYAYIGVGRDDGKTKGEYAAVFYDSTKFKFIRGSTFWLSETPERISVGWDASMERICTYGQFEKMETKERIWVFNTHFDHIGKKARERSADLIIKRMWDINQEDVPAVLIGDLNLTPEEAPIQILKKELKDGAEIAEKPLYGPVGTFNGFNDEIMTRRIDYIFTHDLDVVSYIHVDDRRDNNLFISDHLPVLIKAKI